MAWFETNPKDHLAPRPLLWQGCHPLDQIAQGTTSLAKLSRAGFWHYFVHQYGSAQWSPEIKHKDKAAVWAWEVTAAPQGSEHGGHHRHRTQWWPGDVSGQAKSWICCLSTAKKSVIALWVCTQTQGHDTYSAQGCYQLCVIWMDSPLETLNAEMLHRQRRWLKKIAWTSLNCPCIHSSHICGKNTDCIQKYLLQLPICAAPSALMVQDTSLQLLRAPWRAGLSFLRGWRDWTQPTWAEHSYQTTFNKLLY